MRLSRFFGFCQATLIVALLAPGTSSPAAAADDPILTLKIGAEKRSFLRSELLKRKDLQQVEIAQDPAYPGQKMTYKALPAATLFEGLATPGDAVIQFKCLDGFSAPIDKTRLLNVDPNKSRAFIAIEDPAKPWPPLKPGGPSAGPFYVVWPDPQLSAIGAEEWPFQLASFEATGTLASLYPEILPDPKLDMQSPARRGFAVFTKNCFACHTLNKAGASHVGPDLNLPQNPTEYFVPTALRSLIRDPQSIRHFPNSRMSKFPETALPEGDLSDLIAYLAHMSKRKAPK